LPTAVATSDHFEAFAARPLVSGLSEKALRECPRGQLFLLLRREFLRGHPEVVTSTATELYVLNGTVRTRK